MLNALQIQILAEMKRLGWSYVLGQFDTITEVSDDPRFVKVLLTAESHIEQWGIKKTQEEWDAAIQAVYKQMCA